MNRYNIYGHEGMPENIIGIFSPGHRPVAYSFRPAWPADPYAPTPKKKFVTGWPARWRRMEAQLFPVDPHAPKKVTPPSGFGSLRHPDGKMEYWGCDPKAFEFGEAVDKAIMDPDAPMPGFQMYGFNCAGEIRPDHYYPAMDPTASAFALDALASKIGIRSAVNAMNDAVKDHLDIFLPEVMTHLSDAKLFTQVPGILKSKHLKKKEQIQALELENALLQNQIRQVTAARDRLADKMSIMIGEELKGPTQLHKFLLMPGDCHPAQGTIVYAIHSDLGHVIAWHSAGSWWTRHSLGSGPAMQVTEAHIKWYRKIS